jgi:hypothetical protein
VSTLAVVAAVLLLVVHPPHWYLRALFLFGLLVLPVIFFALAEMSLLSATYAFVIALVGLFGIFAAFAALGVRQIARDRAHSSLGADVLLQRLVGTDLHEWRRRERRGFSLPARATRRRTAAALPSGAELICLT